MIKVRIKRNISEDMLQEAMRVEEMGLPPLIVTFIKEDVNEREPQVRLATILKGSSFPFRMVGKMKDELEWQNLLHKPFTAMMAADREALEAGPPLGRPVEKGDYPTLKIVDPTKKLFQFFYKDLESALWYERKAGRGEDTEKHKPFNLKSIKSMRKAATKGLKKHGWIQEAVDTINLFFDKMIIDFYDNHIRDSGPGTQLIAFLNEHPDNHHDVVKKSWMEASDFAVAYFEQKEDEDKIVKRYPDKDLFWYNIGESYCKIEKEKMGHCGRDDRAILYSLRSKGPKQKVSDSHVTISYNESEATVYQIKGKQNCTPLPKYGPYVVDFLKMFEVVHVEEVGEHSDCDFTEFIEYLREKHPEGEYADNELKALEELERRVFNENYDNKYVSFHSGVEEGHPPFITITGEVTFSVPLPFLQSADFSILKEVFDADEDEIKESIIEAAGFPHLSAYDDDALGLLLVTSSSIFDGPTLKLSFATRDHETHFNHANDAENILEEIRNSYETRDIEHYTENIEKAMNQHLHHVVDSKGAEEFDRIKERIDDINNGYNHFDVSYEEDEGHNDYISFDSHYIPMPIKIPQFPLPQGLTRISNEEKYKQWATMSESYNRYLLWLTNNDIRRAFKDGMKSYHEAAMNHASKQLSLAHAGMDLSPEERPSGFAIQPEFVRLKIIPPLESAVDGKERKGYNAKPHYKLSFDYDFKKYEDYNDILMGMEYIDYIDKNIIEILNHMLRKGKFGEIQLNINHKHAISVTALGQDLVKENKKKLKVKIKFNQPDTKNCA